MGKILSYVMFGFAIMTFMMAASVIRKQFRSRTENIIFVCFALGSTVWSLGFGFLLVQTSVEAAYRLRCIGMIGTFAYMIFATMLMAFWNGKKGWFVKVIVGISLSAVVLYPFLMQRENTTFILTEFGMKYVFKKGLWNNLYTLYCVVIPFNMFILMIQMCRNKKRKWIRAMGQSLLVCELVILSGMVLDTIMPMFGVGAFPGSSLTQFFGAALIYRTLLFYKNNTISINNMSQFVYYSVESPVLIYDYEEKLKLVNKSAVEFLALQEEHEDISLEQLFDVDTDVLKKGKMLMKLDAKCKVNGAHCRLVVNTILDQYQEVLGYIIIADDLTDKIQIIEELEEAKKRADVANRAKSTFLTRMSHEIRTPLNTVFGMNEMILREETSEQIQRYAGSIRDASTILLGIINDILDLSKLEAGKISIYEADYYLPDMVYDILNVVSLTREEKGLGFELDVEEGIPPVLYGDELRIKQIITNIMNNAVKYTDKGRIALRIGWKQIDENQIELKIVVEDTGRGIRQEDMGKLFQPYERLNEQKNQMIEGHGLGLSITKELINLMKGRMAVQSEVGKGSVFTIFIPRIVVQGEELENFRREENLPENIDRLELKDFMEPRVIAEPEREELVLPDVRVLVVDDNSSNLIVMQELLRRTQMKVDLVKSGRDCLRAIQKKEYHMIFLDHMMPEMDGLETLSKIKDMKESPNSQTPIIAMTANAVLGSQQKYVEYGFDDYIAKPIDYRILEDMIRRYCVDKEAVPSAEIGKRTT